MGIVTILVMWLKLFEQIYVPQSQWHSKLNLASIGQVIIEENKFKILNLRDLDQGLWMTLTCGTHKASCTHLVDCIY